MHHSSTRALYEMLPDEEKGDFYSAYVYLKHVQHFAHHVKGMCGIKSVKPEEVLDPGIEEMLQALVQRISEKAMDRDTSTYHQKIVKLSDALQLITQKTDLCLRTPEQVVPYKQAKDIVLQNPGSIALGECACRATSENPCLPPPMEVCLLVGDPHASFIAEHNAKFRKISQEEAVDVVQKAHDMGLVHCAEFKKDVGRRFIALCNCCSCCCLGVQMWNALGGAIPFIAPSGYVAEVGEACSGCGECVGACKFNAIEMEEDRERPTINLAKCMGCGVCETACPADAITLRREPSKGEPLDLAELVKLKD